MRNLILSVLLMCPVAVAQEGVVDIGSRLELFVDHALIDTVQGATLELNHPTAAETVFTFDKPWEGIYCGYVTMIKDGDLCRMYYRGLPVDKADGSDAETTCYAESKDGIHFTRPDLGLFDYEGKPTNIILKGVAPLSHNFAPMIDANPAARPEERFKALSGVEKSGLTAWASADGIHWKKMQEAPVVTKGQLDSQNIAFWSEPEGCYACYIRTWSGTGYSGFRSVSRLTSPDFIHWSDPTEMSFGDTPREHIYTSQTRPYYRAPHIFIATAARFMPERRVVSQEQSAAFGGNVKDSGACSDAVLMTSRGGTTYDRTFMEAFIRPGIGLDNWTARCNYPAWGVIPVNDKEMSIYVQRHYGQATHFLQRLALRVDGFASLHGSYKGGEGVTKPLRFSGKELVLNYATSAAGRLRVEIQDPAGKPLPGYALEDFDAITGDEIERATTWKGKSDLSELAGKPVRLRFVLNDADVYSLRFR